MSHECQHEIELARTQQWREDMTQKIDSLVEAVVGNGKPGLKTDMAVQKQDIGRLWKAFYGLAGVVGTAVVFFGGYLIKG